MAADGKGGLYSLSQRRGQTNLEMPNPGSSESIHNAATPTSLKEMRQLDSSPTPLHSRRPQVKRRCHDSLP